jgi:hypothetical protein
MPKDDLSRFFPLLIEAPPLPRVFNPWSMMDEQSDVGPEAPDVRLRQLKHYMGVREGRARYLLVGEAVGYQGGHFSGIPMTSERILLGYHRDKGIDPDHVLPGLEPRRTSRPEKMEKGFTEPTATIVWETIVKAPCGHQAVVLWNAFPWHPFDERRGLLSNRKPTVREMEKGLKILHHLVTVFQGAQVVAIGRVAERWLNELGLHCKPVRHPAQGGAPDFRAQIDPVLKGKG